MCDSEEGGEDEDAVAVVVGIVVLIEGFILAEGVVLLRVGERREGDEGDCKGENQMVAYWVLHHAS